MRKTKIKKKADIALEIAFFSLLFSFLTLVSLYLNQRMAKTVRTKSRNKCNILDISSDGLTKFCSKIGTSGIQVEQIAINEEPVRSSRPIHGIFSLFKHRLLPAHVISSPSRHSDIYFSQQTNHKTYALHALLHVLFNSTDDMEMNEDLVQFKQSTQKLTPKEWPSISIRYLSRLTGTYQSKQQN
ncbi:hypothetical protein BD560DRAFT_176040 [Blakeslea trispora]|nr:hypothetical protein BD560DRAFT_176040 [Blakeslea trispora]